MEEIKKYLTVAIVAFSKIQFSGAAVVPAGQVMQALQLVSQEVNRIEAESKLKESEKEISDGES